MWDSWILLSCLSMVSFACANLVIGSLSDLGMKSVNYFNSGGLVFAICYFIYNKEWTKTNSLDGKSNGEPKVLMMTWDNKFDWFTFFFCIVSAVMQMFTYFAIIICFKFSHKAGLNIGIAQSIWALNPFMVAVVERVFWGKGLKIFQILGMIALVICSVLVSLSELFTGDGSDQEVVIVDGKTPIYVAVLVTLIMPAVCTVFANFIKYADLNLRLNALDWSCCFNGIMMLIF